MIYDHLGNRWVVGSGEPGTKLISKLIRNNYHLIVLPVELLATGTDSGYTPEVNDLIRSVRMRDCLQVIRGA